MTYGLWLSAGGLQVNEYRQSVAANNMANIDTVGFKRDLAVIHERDVESAARPGQQPFSDRLLDSLSGGVWVRPTYTSYDQGHLEQTGRNLDTAIFGDGFFRVSDGTTENYTRDGRFTLNPDGDLVMVAGSGRYHLLDDNGTPIHVADPTLGPIAIGKDGAVMQDGTAIARLGLADFTDKTQLRKIGENLFENDGDARPVTPQTTVLSGHVERSTVDPISALTDMIEVTRAYEMNARLISLQDDTLGQVVGRVGRIG